MHGIFLNLLQLYPVVDFNTALGISLTFENFFITILLCYMFTALIKLNRNLQRFLFSSRSEKYVIG